MKKAQVFQPLKNVRVNGHSIYEELQYEMIWTERKIDYWDMVPRPFFRHESHLKSLKLYDVQVTNEFKDYWAWVIRDEALPVPISPLTPGERHRLGGVLARTWNNEELKFRCYWPIPYIYMETEESFENIKYCKAKLLEFMKIGYLAAGGVLPDGFDSILEKLKNEERGFENSGSDSCSLNEERTHVENMHLNSNSLGLTPTGVKKANRPTTLFLLPTNQTQLQDNVPLSTNYLNGSNSAVNESPTPDLIDFATPIMTSTPPPIINTEEETSPNVFPFLKEIAQIPAGIGIASSSISISTGELICMDSFVTSDNILPACENKETTSKEDQFLDLVEPTQDMGKQIGPLPASCSTPATSSKKPSRPTTLSLPNTYQQEFQLDEQTKPGQENGILRSCLLPPPAITPTDSETISPLLSPNTDSFFIENMSQDIKNKNLETPSSVKDGLGRDETANLLDYATINFSDLIEFKKKDFEN